VHLFIAAMWVTSTLAIIGSERRIRWLVAVFKPLTTLLLFAVIGVPHGRFAGLVTAGVALSVVGDTALLWESDRAFIVGLAAFLLGHLAYAVAFLGVAVWSSPVAIAAVIVSLTSILLLRAIWEGASGMHAPTVAYGATITVMVVSAWATVGGPLTAAPFAALGATLFYVSDASLALNKFRRPLPHPALLAMGVYWLGQLGIAIAASASL